MCAVCCDVRQETDVPDLIPARMLNEFCYCPRLAYLEWVQGEFADNLETREGRFGHRRVDKASAKEVPEPDDVQETGKGGGTRGKQGDAKVGADPLTPDPRPVASSSEECIHSRSVMLSAPGEGLIARIDVLDLKSSVAVPVDYKRGKVPDVPGGAWEPEQVQLCAQGLKEYFAGFARMLKEESPFSIEGRNRRPPRDPVNALLSFVYAILVKELTIVLHVVGFDPMRGFFHQPRYGRPSLALDLAEEFRPLIGDSVVLTLINNGEVTPSSFIRRAGAVALTDAGRRAVITAFERRMDTLVTHPIFGYRISYRRVLEVQSRLLARTILGEIPRYASSCTR